VEQDSNLRGHKPPVLQTGSFSRSDIHPVWIDSNSSNGSINVDEVRGTGFEPVQASDHLFYSQAPLTSWISTRM
jgi:hypothetical protein